MLINDRTMLECAAILSHGDGGAIIANDDDVVESALDALNENYRDPATMFNLLFHQTQLFLGLFQAILTCGLHLSHRTPSEGGQPSNAYLWCAFSVLSASGSVQQANKGPSLLKGETLKTI
jgi:hypothetical protein